MARAVDLAALGWYPPAGIVRASAGVDLAPRARTGVSCPSVAASPNPPPILCSPLKPRACAT